MKKKALSALIVAAVATTTLLTACTTPSKQLQFSPNWQSDTFTGNELIGTVDESFVYDISFTSGDGMQGEKYDVEYCVDENGNPQKGVYTYSVYGDAGTQKYVLEASCQIPVLYTYNGETKPHLETMTSRVEFLKTDTRLQPISSYKKVDSYSPVLSEPTKVSECYIVYNYEIEIQYNANCSGSESITFTDHQGTYLADGTNDVAKETIKTDLSFDIDKSEYTYLDNEQIFFALRGLSNSAMQSTAYFNSYNYATRSVRNLIISPLENGTTADFKESLVNGVALKDKTTEGKIDYNAITLAINEQNRGQSLELWYAKTTDVSNNAYRNMLLKMKEPLMYNLGTLSYTLNSATFAF